MFGQKSEEFYQDKQQYYDAEYALELMDKNNAKTVTFQNVFGKSVTLTKNAAKQIKTEVERSVQAIEIKKELINSLWQKFEQDESHAPKIYSENALNEVLEGLGYEADDLVLPPFNNLPNAQAQAPAYNYVDRDDEDALDSLSNARAQRPMHNDLNEQDEFGTMAIYKRGVEQGGFGGDFNDAHAGNNQLDTFNAEQGNAFNNLDHTQANDFLTKVQDFFEPVSKELHQYERSRKIKSLRYYRSSDINDLDCIIKLEYKEEKDQQNIKQKIISLRNSYFNDQSFHHPKQKPVVEEIQLISGMAGIQFQQSSAPKARTSLAQSKPQEAAITQPRNSDEEVEKVKKWFKDNNLSELTSFSTLLLKKYYQDPSQKSNLDKICDNDGIWGTNRQKLISLITGESSVREKFLSELDKNGLKVSSSTEMLLCNS